MKTQEEILSKIEELENDIAEFKDVINNSTEWDIKSDYNRLIFEVEKKNLIIKLGIGGIKCQTNIFKL